MALTIKKSPIKYHDFIIPGGWECRVPEIRLIERDEAVYVAFWVRQGMSRKAAVEKVIQVNQDIYTTRFSMLIRQTIGRQAAIYRQRWPELDLEGYDPATIAKIYVPGHNMRVVGKPLYSKALTAMAEEVLK